MRDRLEELLMECFDIDEDGYYCLNERQKDDIVQEIADHLIKNGVTMQQWIPVSERLPTEGDANEIGGVLAVRVDCGSTIVDSFHWTTVGEFNELFTHWMPLLLEPPKE